jgi:hypothetical protein
MQNLQGTTSPFFSIFVGGPNNPGEMIHFGVDCKKYKRPFPSESVCLPQKPTMAERFALCNDLETGQGPLYTTRTPHAGLP